MALSRYSRYQVYVNAMHVSMYKLDPVDGIERQGRPSVTVRIRRTCQLITHLTLEVVVVLVVNLLCQTKDKRMRWSSIYNDRKVRRTAPTTFAICLDSSLTGCRNLGIQPRFSGQPSSFPPTSCSSRKHKGRS